MINSTSHSYRLLFWLVAFVGLTADQCSKYGVFAYLYDSSRPEGSIEVIPGAFEIVARYTADKEPGNSWLSYLRTVSADHLPYVNKGALWGTTLHLTPEGANFVFTLISIVAALGIIYWSTRGGTSHDRTLCCALGLILAGTLGNLYDRLVFSGVRDFLWWHKFVDWPVFNIADSCLVCGAGLLLLEAFFTSTEPPRLAEPVASNANSAGSLL